MTRSYRVSQKYLIAGNKKEKEQEHGKSKDKSRINAHYHRDQSNCYAADIIKIIDDSAVAIKYRGSTIS
jgi:hypothetical protein